ncbi:MAG: MFS transporter [Methylotenera sp.]|nr:MFS transporter [Oligoflexia bacterium]
MALLNAFKQVLPILLLLAVISLILVRLPKVDLGHSAAFKKRRLLNWLPLGLTYAFLYMGRYNLTVSKNALGDAMSNSDFGTIFFWGTIVYGFAFVINGPLTDRIGGRAAMLLGATGAAISNILMGFALVIGMKQHIVLTFSILYGANMYFQSFGAVSIVKVNAGWFHLRERGTFGGIFGILISLGLYFAYDWSEIIVKNAPIYWVFFIPAIILMVFVALDFLFVRDNPSDAGFADFDLADASSGDTGPQLSAWTVGKAMLTNPIIMTIAAIEFCSGFLRNSVMQWYIIFAKQTNIMNTFVPKNWGLLLCCAGIMGGVFAGTLSDKVFQSRRGPMAAVLYGFMLIGAGVMGFLFGSPFLGYLVVFMSLCFIGVHGMLSGTASMDFGGKKNVGVAVGLIDGMVYLGTAFQSILFGSILPTGAAAKDPANWKNWPMVMIPVALIGLLLGMRLWNVKPSGKKVIQGSENLAPIEAGEVLGGANAQI